MKRNPKNKAPNLLDIIQEDVSQGNTTLQERNRLEKALREHTGHSSKGIKLKQVLETDDGDLEFYVFPSAPFGNEMFHLILSSGKNHQGRLHLCVDISGYENLQGQKLKNLQSVADSFSKRHNRPPLQFQSVIIKSKPHSLLEIDSDMFDIVAPVIDKKMVSMEGKRSNWITVVLWALTLIPMAYDGIKYFFKKSKKSDSPVKKNPVRKNTQKTLFDKFLSGLDKWNKISKGNKESLQSLKQEFEDKRHLLLNTKIILGDKIR
jgi:hypothetical protein